MARGKRITMKEACDHALKVMQDAERKRLETAELEARQHACPDCADKDAEIKHLRDNLSFVLKSATMPDAVRRAAEAVMRGDDDT